MNKPILGLLLGTFLGLLDGASAWFYPEAHSKLAEIIIGSTIKGLLTGVLAGYFARKVNNIWLGICFGLGVGILLGLAAAYNEGGGHYFEIVLPGSILGLIVGFATQKYPRPASQSN